MADPVEVAVSEAIVTAASGFARALVRQSEAVAKFQAAMIRTREIALSFDLVFFNPVAANAFLTGTWRTKRLERLRLLVMSPDRRKRRRGWRLLRRGDWA